MKHYFGKFEIAYLFMNIVLIICILIAMSRIPQVENENEKLVAKINEMQEQYNELNDLYNKEVENNSSRIELLQGMVQELNTELVKAKEVNDAIMLDNLRLNQLLDEYGGQ